MLIEESYYDVKTSYDTTMRLFVYHPKVLGFPNIKFPGVVVYSEIYQVTGPVQRFAKDIAGQGYIVVCPSIYHNFEGPAALAYDVEGTDKGNNYKVMKEVKSYDEDNKLAIDYLLSLPSCNGKIGTTGMCLGGHLAFRGALDPRVSATFCFFATDIHNHALGKGGDDSLARCKEINGEIILVFGEKDNHVPFEGRTLIRQKLHDENVKHTLIEVYDAQHAFIRDESSKGRYDPAVTKNCMEWLFELFNRKLKLEYGQEAEKPPIENVC